MRLISHWFQAQLHWKLLAESISFCQALQNIIQPIFSRSQNATFKNLDNYSTFVMIATKHYVTREKHTSDQAPVLHWAGQGILLHGLLISGFSPLQYLLWMERFVPSWRNWTQRTVRIWYPKLPQVLVQCSHSSVIHLSDDKWNMVQSSCCNILNAVSGSWPPFTVRILNSYLSALFIHSTPLNT